MLSGRSSGLAGALESREVDLCDTLRQKAMSCNNSKNGNDSSVRPRLTGRLMVKYCHTIVIESFKIIECAQDPRLGPESYGQQARATKERTTSAKEASSSRDAQRRDACGKSREPADLIKRKDIPIICLQETR
ncbi:unnamed protein product [Nippostrongylus brasiliensis]|uniref:Uncharacterized protein n=1 Tax=Nippostrongylus brasiliensis TaxID=27835 RepID=A0A0N4YMT2_NIPBR|nr:unnamed protein product [Nippostrongylus brasiliensis]